MKGLLSTPPSKSCSKSLSGEHPSFGRSDKPLRGLPVHFRPQPPKLDLWFYACYSVTQSCFTLCYPMDCSTPGFPVFHYLPELAQTHVHLVGDVIQPSHPLSSPFPLSFNLFQHQGLFWWVGSLHQVAKVLELQHQFFQINNQVDFL